MKFTKRDLLFCIITLLLAGCFCVLVFLNVSEKSGETVEIFCRGELISTISLKKDQMVKINDNNTDLILEIKDGTAFVQSSACDSQDCVHSPAISKKGQVILCAPQQILIQISTDAVPAAVVS